MVDVRAAPVYVGEDGDVATGGVGVWDVEEVGGDDVEALGIPVELSFEVRPEAVAAELDIILCQKDGGGGGD